MPFKKPPPRLSRPSRKEDILRGIHTRLERMEQLWNVREFDTVLHEYLRLNAEISTLRRQFDRHFP